MADLYGDTAGGTLVTVDANRQAVSDVTEINYFGNKSLTWMLVDFVADASGETNENEAIMAVVNTIEKYATIVIRGDLFDTGSQMAVAVEQINDSQDWDGLGATTLAQQIDDEVNALGATYGNNSNDMTAVTVTVKTSMNIS